MKHWAPLFFLSASFLLIGCQPKDAAPHLILTNGHIWTGEDSTSFVEAIAIRGNTITQIGDRKTIEALKGDSTQVIDLEGKLVTAGFNDAHIHFLSGSLALSEANHLDGKSVEDVVNAVLRFAKDNPDREWITGRGWQYSFFPSGMPDHGSLAALDIDRPVLISAYDGHSSYANRKALALAGITRNTTFSGFGEIVKDKKGEPTGMLKESATRLVSKLVPPVSFDDKLRALKIGMNLAASLGITSLQNANGSEEEIKLFSDLLKRNELTVRYAASFSVGQQTTDDEIARFAILKDSLGDHPFLRADAIKFMIDGVVESHTAAMIEPYADVDPASLDARGKLNLTIDRYRELAKALDAKGFRLYTHAIGDRGVRESLNAYEAAITENKSVNRRHRIEHIETINPADINRFFKLGVMASMEPIHADPGTIHVWAKAIGESRLPYSFAWNDLLKEKAHLVFSSDWPAAISVNPIRGIHVAVNRQTPDGYPAGGWVSHQKVTIAQALKAYTWAGAYSSFEENKKGKLLPGFWADVIVHSDDLFEIPSSDIHRDKVMMTILDGKIIYRQSGF